MHSISGRMTQNYEKSAPIERLPVEIKTNIFSFLSWELLKLPEVCYNFYQLTFDDRLWNKPFKTYFSSYDLKLNEKVYKQFQRAILIENNWNKMRYSIQSIPTEVAWSSKFLVTKNQIFIEGSREIFIAYDKITLRELFRCPEKEDDFEDFTDNSEYLITNANGGPCSGASIKIWDKNTGSLISHIPGGIRCLADGDKCMAYQAIGLLNPPYFKSQITVWNKHTNTLLYTLQENEGVRHIALDNSYYYAGMGNGTIKTWCKSDGRFLGIFEGLNTPPITSLIDEGDTLISGHKDGSIWIWSKQHKSMSYNLALSQSTEEEVYSLHIINHQLLSRHSKSIQVWNLATRNLVCAVPGGSAFCYEKEIVYIGVKGAEAGSGSVIMAYHLITGELLFQIPCSSGEQIYEISVLHSHLFVLTHSSSTTSLEVWELKNCSLLKIFNDVGAFHVENEKLTLSIKGEVQILNFSQPIRLN